MAGCCVLLAWGGAYPEPDSGPDLEARTVREVSVRSDGPLSKISDGDVHTLIELSPGEPFSFSRAKHSVQRLYSTQLFFDIQVRVQEIEPDEVDVTFVLIRKYLVDDIQFTGRVRLDTRLLRREIQLRQGDPYADALLEESLARLERIYQRHGYYQARITPRFELKPVLAHLKVRFEIEAGPQARVARLELDTDVPLDEREIRSLIKTQEGQPFAPVQAEEDRRALEHHFALQGFLRSEIYFRDEVYDAATNTVSLTLRIVPRSHYRIEFEGIDPREEDLSHLLMFVERGTAQVLLDESVRQLREGYQQQGYFLAQADYEVVEENVVPSHVRILVDKGRRYRISDIFFEGNESISSGSLERILSVRRRGLFSRGVYTTGKAQADAERIQSYYRQRGFMDASASPELRPRAPDSTELVVTYRIQEGRRYFVENVEIAGNHSLPMELLERELASRPGEAFSPMAVAQDRANLIAVYENEGFREIDFRTEIVHLESEQVRITYFIDEGPQFFVDSVIVTGNTETRSSVIRREIRVIPQDPLSLGRILDTEANLYDLSVFNRVRVAETPSYLDPLKKTVLINLEEARKYTLLYGIGYSSAEGPRGTFGVSNNNVLGTARVLSLGLRLGDQRQRGNISYTIPRPFDFRLPTVVSLVADNEKRVRLDEENLRSIRGRPFDALRLIVSSQSEYPISRRETFFFRYRFENVRLDVPSELDEFLPFFREERVLRLSSLGISYLNESRDDPLDPTEGFLLTGEAQLSARLMGSEKQFFRILTQGQYYQPLAPGVVFVNSLRIGLIAPFGETPRGPAENPVPISERFFSGGPTTLRGLSQDLAGPLLRNPETGLPIMVPVRDREVPVPLGGNFLVIGNSELRFPIFRFLSGAVFYDIGNVFQRIGTVGSERFHNAVGAGLRISTPVGPLRFDAGYNPNPPDIEGFKAWNFHFTLGHPF